MTQPFDAADLQSLWDDLNRDEEDQRQQDLEARLRQRAEQYAHVPDDADETDALAMQVLVLRVGTELYGVDVMRVRGVRTMETLTRVPGVPDFYRGVINVRGQIVSVLDLHLFLGLHEQEDDVQDANELVLVEGANLYLALLVDRVMHVASIQHSQIAAIDARFAQGITSDRLVLLDVDTLLNDQRLIIGGEIDS